MCRTGKIIFEFVNEMVSEHFFQGIGSVNEMHNALESIKFKSGK
jgi:hypothetical protein